METTTYQHEPERQPTRIASMTFSREDHLNRVTLRLTGSLDALSAPRLRTIIDSLLSERCPVVRLDLTALKLIDSTGVGALVSLYKRALSQGNRVDIEGLSGQPLAIFRLLRLEHLFPKSNLA